MAAVAQVEQGADGGSRRKLDAKRRHASGIIAALGGLSALVEDAVGLRWLRLGPSRAREADRDEREDGYCLRSSQFFFPVDAGGMGDFFAVAEAEAAASGSYAAASGCIAAAVDVPMAAGNLALGGGFVARHRRGPTSTCRWSCARARRGADARHRSDQGASQQREDHTRDPVRALLHHLHGSQSGM